MTGYFVRIPLLKVPPLNLVEGGIDEEALASALQLEIGNMEQLTELVCVASRDNAEIPLLVNRLMDHTIGLAQAAGLVDLSTDYRVAYSDSGRKRLVWAIDIENKKNNDEDDDQLCEGEP